LKIHKYLFALIFVSVLASNNLQAQNPIKTHDHQNLIWVGYFPTIAINPRLAILADYQFRRKDWLGGWSQKVFRQGIAYKVNKNLDLSGGFVYLQHHKVGLIQNEFRPFQQALIFNNFSGLKIDHRYRFEQRFIRRFENNMLKDGYFTSYRLRYKISIAIPIRVQQTETRWALYVDNETMIHFGEEIINIFDQNRFSLGVNYRVSENIRLQMGYMNLYAQRATMGRYENADIIRFNIFHRINLYSEN
jgi:hypothetical protein